MTVVVSEETGRVTLASDGKLTRMNDPESLRQAITVESKDEANSGKFRLWKGKHRNERKAE